MAADLVLWNAAPQVTFGADDMADGASYNPWERVTAIGWPETVVVRGEVIMDKGLVTVAFGRGRWPVAEPAAELRGGCDDAT